VTEKQLTDLAEMIGQGIGQSLTDNFGPQRIGFVLVMFDRAGHPLSLVFSSSEQTEDTIKRLRTLLAALKGGPRSD
jgi:hypothetical protein